jgi:hypothetical protein
LPALAGRVIQVSMANLSRTLAFVSLAAALAVGAGPTRQATAGRAARQQQRSPDGKLAEVRGRPAGGDGVFIDGRLAWPVGARRSAQVTAPLRWARGGHAVALLAREQQQTKLVVVLVDGAAAGQALEWPLPREALPARAIMWLDATHVAVGPAEMEPKLVASFSVDAR